MTLRRLSHVGRGRRGLTLIETIVVIFVFSLLTLTITQLLTGGIQAWKRGNTRMKLRADAREAVDQIQADFRQCSGVGVGVITPSAAGAPSSTLQFSRYDNTGTGATKIITYTINSAARTLTRQEGTDVTVLAENVVDIDPRDSARKSYFQWQDSGLTTMGIHLYLVQDAAVQLLNAGASQSLESVTMHSGAYWAGQGPSITSPNRVPVSVVTPASLRDPRPPFRLSLPR